MGYKFAMQYQPLILSFMLALGASTAAGALNAASAPASPRQTTPQAAYPLAPGYQPGKRTELEKTAPQSPYDADEAVRRILRIITETQSAQDLTLERVERTLGVQLPVPTAGNSLSKNGDYWLNDNWLFSQIYSPHDPAHASEAYFKVEFRPDPEHWTGLPDRNSLCANRTMDIAAAEKVLLAHGFFMTREPSDTSDSWSYFNGKHVSVRLTSFGDAGFPPRKDICIRSISLMPEEAK